MNIERKDTPRREVKLASNATREFSGYLAGYGNIDGCGDVFEPGAFAQSLSEIKSTDEWPALLLNHGGWDMVADDLLPVGIYVDLSEDDYGLKFSAALADTQRGNDIYTLLKMTPRPAIKGMSVGYVAQQYRYETDPNNRNREIRRITQAKLVEGSIVTFPANKNAEIRDVKSGSGWDRRSLENLLARAGMPPRELKTLLDAGLAAIESQRNTSLESLAAALRKNINLLKA